MQEALMAAAGMHVVAMVQEESADGLQQPWTPKKVFVAQMSAGLGQVIEDAGRVRRVLGGRAEVRTRQPGDIAAGIVCCGLVVAAEEVELRCCCRCGTPVVCCWREVMCGVWHGESCRSCESWCRDGTCCIQDLHGCRDSMRAAEARAPTSTGTQVMLLHGRCRRAGSQGVRS